MNTYRINEIFYSLQGEGGRAGHPSFFLRFSGCNMECQLEAGPKSPGGFDCDTEFRSGTVMTVEQIVERMKQLNRDCKWIVLTGGEPGLQVVPSLIDHLHSFGYKLAIESNGSIALPPGLDWITISPKVAEHCVRQSFATEVKYVRAKGQGIPRPTCKADLQYISPAWSGHGLDKENLDWCIQLCRDNPDWNLSLQQHKIWSVR